MTIFLTGFMGTGKTTVGKDLARRLDLPFIDTDQEIERIEGRPITAIFADDGEEHFRGVEKRVIEELPRCAVVATGGGATVDPANRRVMRAAGPIICLSATPEAIYERTARNRVRPLLFGDDPRARIRELLAQRASVYADADYTVDTTDVGVGDVVDAILGFLKDRPDAEALR